jgi:trimeric autotransporter adhesin
MSIISIISSSGKSAADAPTIGTATNVGTGRAYNNGAATVTFTAPTYTGRSAITSYTVTSSPGGFTGSGASSPVTVTGLQSATAYTFTVTATNAAGFTSAASAASNSITATTVPQAPTIGTATAGEGSATVTYTAGASGGSAITTFTATSSPGSLTGTGASPITVSGLTNGTAYTFTVTATNANGTSTASAASNSVTPAIIGAIQAWSNTGTVANQGGNNGYRYFMAGALWGSDGQSTYRYVAIGGNNPVGGQVQSAYRYDVNNTVTGLMPLTEYATPTNWTLGQGNRPAFANNYNGIFYYYDRARSTSAFSALAWSGGSANKTNFPTARSQQNLTSSSLGIYAYGTGVSDTTSTTQNARWVENSWTTLTSMPSAVCFIGAAAGGGYAMSVGGSTTHSQSGPTNASYLYNESGNSWSTVTNYPQSKTQMSASWVGVGSTGVTTNRYYFMNGFLTGFGQDALAYSYAVSTNAWRAERNSPGNAYSIMTWTGTTVNANNILTMAGGEDGSSARPIYSAQVI